jgi:Protein of unknown function (DUF3592)
VERSSRPKGLMWFCLVICSMLLIMMVQGLIGSLYTFSESISAANWPSVVGKLENVSWQESEGKGGTYYKVKVKYNYSIDNRKYHNDTLAFGYAASKDRETHERIFSKLQQTKAISVCYNFKHPDRSILGYGINSWNIESILGSTFFCGIFTLMLVVIFGELRLIKYRILAAKNNKLVELSPLFGFLIAAGSGLCNYFGFFFDNAMLNTIKTFN